MFRADNTLQQLVFPCGTLRPMSPLDRSAFKEALFIGQGRARSGPLSSVNARAERGAVRDRVDAVGQALIASASGGMRSRVRRGGFAASLMESGGLAAGSVDARVLS